MRRNAKRAAPAPRADSAGGIVHAQDSTASRPPSGRDSQSQYKHELQHQISQNQSRKAAQRSEEARLAQQADAEAERFDYWRKPRPGGGTPNQPQYLADRGGDPAYRPPKKGMSSPGDSVPGHRRAASSGPPPSGGSGAPPQQPRVPRHGNHSRAMSEAYAGAAGGGEERGFLDYFFNPRPGGGTPVRGSKGEVVANLRTALTSGAVNEGYDHIAHQHDPRSAQAPAGAETWDPPRDPPHEASNGALTGSPALHASPIKPTSHSAVTAGRRSSPLHAQLDTRSEVAELALGRLQGQLQAALQAQAQQQQELQATQAQLDMAVQLLEEYKQLYGPLPPTGGQ